METSHRKTTWTNVTDKRNCLLCYRKPSTKQWMTVGALQSQAHVCQPARLHTHYKTRYTCQPGRLQTPCGSRTRHQQQPVSLGTPCKTTSTGLPAWLCIHCRAEPCAHASLHALHALQKENQVLLLAWRKKKTTKLQALDSEFRQYYT